MSSRSPVEEEADARPPDGARRVLAGDIGGTHARLAIVEARGEALHVLQARRFRSAEFDALAPVLERFLAELASDEQGNGAPRSGAAHSLRGCLALAATRHGRAWESSNLGWRVDSEAVRSAVGLASLEIVNDFHALAAAVDWLAPEDLEVLQSAPAQAGAPRVFLGAGTGLGTALSVWCGDRYRIVESEGGHADLAPTSAREAALLADLWKRHEHVSYERVLSGAGLEATYRHLADRGIATESDTVARRMAAENPAAVISEFGLARTDPLCTEALDLFVTLYGAQAGNLALTAQARGGVFVAGGIAPRILPKLRDGTFMEAFRRKGRLSAMLEEVPVSVVTRDDAGLLGAGALALAGR